MSVNLWIYDNKQAKLRTSFTLQRIHFETTSAIERSQRIPSMCSRTIDLEKIHIEIASLDILSRFILILFFSFVFCFCFYFYYWAYKPSRFINWVKMSSRMPALHVAYRASTVIGVFISKARGTPTYNQFITRGMWELTFPTKPQ